MLFPVALMLNPVEDCRKNFFLAADVQLRVRNEVLDLEGEEESQLVIGRVAISDEYVVITTV